VNKALRNKKPKKLPTRKIRTKIPKTPKNQKILFKRKMLEKENQTKKPTENLKNQNNFWNNIWKM